MPNSEQYWLDRTADIVAKSETNEAEAVTELKSIFQHGTKQIQKEINAFYGKYTRETGLSLDEAKKKVDKSDLNSFREDIQYFVKHRKDVSKTEIEQWRLLRAKFNTTRLSLLNAQLEMVLIRVYGDVEITMENALKTNVAETFYLTSGLVGSFASLPVLEIEQIVNFPWSGAMFSDLLWEHKERLVRNLKKVMTTGIITGDSSRNIARNLRNEVESSVYASERLIRTEMNRVMNEATLKSYEMNGLTHYIFKANIDEKTSNVCKRHDEKVYKLSERKVGVNASPLHPHCRSYSLPYTDNL